MSCHKLSMAQYHARKRDIKVKPVVKVVDCFAKDKKDKKQKFACKDCSNDAKSSEEKVVSGVKHESNGGAGT